MWQEYPLTLLTELYTVILTANKQMKLLYTAQSGIAETDSVIKAGHLQMCDVDVQTLKMRSSGYTLGKIVSFF